MATGFRFEPLAKIASGGTATVYVGRATGDKSGATVAIKRPHPHVLDDARQRQALLREARVVEGLQHPNVVYVREVEERGAEMQLVMDYVEGTALGSLIAHEAERSARMPAGVAVRIVLDALAGLSALHERRDAEGRILGLVHRDVSPQNILVGVDGVARLTDFGLAKAAYDGAPSTTQGTLKGKLGYMAPEYVSRGQVDPGIDVFAMGVVLWEALVGRRLFRGDNEGQTLDRVLHEEAPLLASIAPELAQFDAVMPGALAKDPVARLASAREWSQELESVAGATGTLATREEVGAYVAERAAAELEERRARVREALRAGGGRKRTLVAVAAVGVVVFGGALAVGLGHAKGSAATGSTSSNASASAITSNASATTTTTTLSNPTPTAAPSGDPVADAAAPDSGARAASSSPKPTDTSSRRSSPIRSLPPNPYVHRPPSR